MKVLDHLFRVYVESLDDHLSFYEYHKRMKSEIVRDRKIVPTGVNMTVRHPDGSIFEYVEHRKYRNGL